MFVFAIVSAEDRLIYSANLTSDESTPAHLAEFIIYAALDAVDRVKTTSNDAYLRVVDRFNESSLLVSAFLTVSGVRLLLLHRQAAEEVIRIFFQEVYLLSLRDLPVSSVSFDTQVRDLAHKLLLLISLSFVLIDLSLTNLVQHNKHYTISASPL